MGRKDYSSVQRIYGGDSVVTRNLVSGKMEEGREMRKEEAFSYPRKGLITERGHSCLSQEKQKAKEREKVPWQRR